MNKITFNKFVFYSLAAAAITAAMLPNVFGQTKTASISPCVDLVAPNAKTVNRVWANLDYPPCKTAINGLRSASVIVLGRELVPNNSSDDYVLQEWLFKIAGNPTWKAKFDDDSFGAVQAIKWLKETAQPQEYRLNQIFQEIYGRDILGFEKLFYGKAIETKEMWYAPIYLNERKKLGENSAEREKMIVRAFQTAKNRLPNADEIKYWKPRSEIYREIVKTLKK